jgi:hypothetical protein
MVFGWGKKTQKKESDIAVGTEKEISFKEIPKVLDEIQSLRTKTIISEAKSFRKYIESQKEELLKIANHLEKDDLKIDDFDKHLQILVVRGKKLVISTIKRETTEKLPEISSHDDISSLVKQSSQLLKRIGDVLGKQSRVIHIFAKKYAGQLKQHLAVLESNRKEFQSMVNNFSSFQESISSVFEKIEHYKSSQQSIEDTNQRISDLKSSIEQYQQTIDSTKKNIEDLKSSEEYSQFMEITKKITSLSSEENHIKSQVDLQFTKISRPLSKYGYISSLDKPQKKLMENLEANPFAVLISSNKDDIVQILYAVRRGVEAGSVSVKDSEKSVGQIDETISMLDEFLKKIHEFMEQKNSLENKLKVFDVKKLKEKEVFLEKTLHDKNDAESRTKDLGNTNEELKKSLPNILIEIEQKLQNISNTKYRLSV